MEQNAYQRARHQSESTAMSAQELNRKWWESLPMTYVDWDEADRLPQDFVQVEQAFLQNNPWIGDNFDFTALRGKRVLEIGCGAGAASCLFARAGAKVVAIDLTATAAKLTEMNSRSQKLKVDVLNMDAEKTAFAKGSFDFVFSWGVLHHSSNPLRAFSEVSRVLGAGGAGLIMVYNRSSLRYWLKGLYWLIIKGRLFFGDTLQSVQRHYTDGYYHQHYTPAELVALLASAGLEVQRISIDHMNKKMIPLIPRALDDYLKRTFGWLLIVEFIKTRAND